MSQVAPIALENVSYLFGKGALQKQILFDISTTIHAGEIVILTGPSGSGKTTLLTLIGALRSVSHGSVKVLGQELNSCSEKGRIRVRRQIGYIFQSHNLLNSLTISQNVQMALQLGGMRASAGKERVTAVLERVGLGDQMDKHPAQLSGGQKQRAGIARALVNRPSVILADEPTASLDKHSGRDVVELIQDLAREDGAAVVLVTHDNRVLDIADRILHLEDGHLKSLTDAMSEGTSRMLNLMEKHDPDAASYLSSFAFSLARVAYADEMVTDTERQEMRRILHEVADLNESEVEFIMELSMMQKRARPSSHQTLGSPAFDESRARHLIESLHAIANADGNASPEEISEIESIAAEFGVENYSKSQGA